jgi:hypothetical protein
MVNMVIAAMIYNGLMAARYDRTPSLWPAPCVVDGDGVVRG